MYKLVLTLLFTGLYLSLNAQKPFHQIKVSLEGLKDTNVYLAHYYGSKVLKTDSVRLDKRGNGTFSGNKELPPGIYLIYLNDKNYFDFLLGADQEFTISASFKPGAKRTFTGAKETEAFQQYQEYLSKQRVKQQRIQKEQDAHKNNPDSVKILSNEMEALNLEMETYWSNKSDEYKGTFFADFLRSMIPVKPATIEVPPGTANADSFRWAKNYAFTRDHYWDNFNFAQPGMILTPILDNRIDTYFKKVLLQIPDSVLGPTIRFIEKSKADKEMFHYMALNRLNSTLNSEIMGMDKVFVEIGERYFLKEKTDWLDSTARAKIAEKVYVTKPNLLGNLAPELKLPDSEGNYYSLRQMNGKFTVLYFWEPNCSHCKKATPLMEKDLYESLRDKGVEIYAVCTQTNKDEWMKGMNEYNIHEWTNVWDPLQESNFRVLYDVFSTPVIYILDKSKHIIAKRIDVETAARFLKDEMEKATNNE
jgi:thiol-disulfide isomerase/thioredoxin